MRSLQSRSVEPSASSRAFHQQKTSVHPRAPAVVMLFCLGKTDVSETPALYILELTKQRTRASKTRSRALGPSEEEAREEVVAGQKNSSHC
eukprot:COSAG02_NODE_1933_length_10319_cov_22.624168_6_plen_91_part_00